MNSQTFQLSISKAGVIRTIYDDSLLPLLAQGQSKTRRASHVEPGPGGWWADMSPVRGPELGPYLTRAEALAAEVEYLKAHVI